MALDQSLIAQQAELERLGFKILQTEPDKIAASRRSFYWECFFTFVNYTVFVQRIEVISAEKILSDRTHFISESKRLNPSALPRGMQSGNAILVVYVADEVESDARGLCEGQGKLGFAEFYVPAALDLSRNAGFMIQKTPAWGAIYYQKFRYILSRILSPKGTPNQEPLSKLAIVLTVIMGILPLLAVFLFLLAAFMR